MNMPQIVSNFLGHIHFEGIFYFTDYNPKRNEYQTIFRFNLSKNSNSS